MTILTKLEKNDGKVDINFKGKYRLDFSYKFNYLKDNNISEIDYIRKEECWKMQGSLFKLWLG